MAKSKVTESTIKLPAACQKSTMAPPGHTGNQYTLDEASEIAADVAYNVKVQNTRKSGLRITGDKDAVACFKGLLEDHKEFLKKTAAEQCTGCEDGSWRTTAQQHIETAVNPPGVAATHKPKARHRH